MQALGVILGVRPCRGTHAWPVPNFCIMLSATDNLEGKMKTLRVGIATYEEMKAKTVAIARGLHRPAPDDPKVWFTSAEAFA
jgi:hypothetical protein